MDRGTLSGPVRVEWVENDPRLMVVLNDIYFIDSKGMLWVARAGSWIDGASIPRICWALTGSPYVGKYREASVLHDVYCDTQSRPWQEVHRMFNEVMMSKNVPALKRHTMYNMVRQFGPRW